MAETMKCGARIKILLIERGITQAAIAEDLGYSRAYVGQIIHGEKQTAKVRKAIAKRIGMPVEELWGNGG